MGNYQKMFRYAKSFAGDHGALDIVHSLWLRYKNTYEKDLLIEKLSNRFLYKMIRNEYFNQFNRSNRYVEINYDTHLHELDPLAMLEAKEANQHMIDRIIKLVLDKKKRSKSYDLEKQLEIFLGVYELMKLGYGNKEISLILDVSEQVILYYRKQIQGMALHNPFNGSKTKITRTITRATWNMVVTRRISGKKKKVSKYDHSEYEQEDYNEYYELWVNKESGDGLLVKLPEPKLFKKTKKK